MEIKLLSNRVKHEIVPDNYIYPVHQRPGIHASAWKQVPIINLAGDNQADVSNQILSAGKDFGVFRVINHGIPQQLIDDMLALAQEFFEMPAEDKAPYLSEDPTKEPRLFTGHRQGNITPVCWRDCLFIPTYPVGKYEHLYPEKPNNLKETMAKFTPEARGLATRILKLISVGLGLEEDYLAGNRSGGPMKMLFNYYPPCPDPSLTLGIPRHCDPDLVTLLFQAKVSGLQVLHDDQWVSVDPLPSAIVVNFGHLFEVISNGLLKAVEHRVVTNRNVARTTVSVGIRSADDCVIGPADALASDDSNPPLYRSFMFPEFVKAYTSNTTYDREINMEAFKIKN
ncbi:protein DOWNY MILDEW RESISTANCE 6-like [Asparagus officinalis]|nr:protein DOWNY MILDEW RESISTANCE 6-like [Asparagus officinalis]